VGGCRADKVGFTGEGSGMLSGWHMESLNLLQLELSLSEAWSGLPRPQPGLVAWILHSQSSALWENFLGPTHLDLNQVCLRAARSGSGGERGRIVRMILTGTNDTKAERFGNCDIPERISCFMLPFVLSIKI
jgi:hypothetical protein